MYLVDQFVRRSWLVMAACVVVFTACGGSGHSTDAIIDVAAVECEVGFMDCGGVCTKLGTDDNCSRCRDTCAGVKTCEDGRCIAQTDPECLPTIPCVDDEDCTSGNRCNQAISPPACQKLYCGGFETACSEDYFCLSQTCHGDACMNDCSGLECGPDPIYGESCGGCQEGATCKSNHCVCEPEDHQECVAGNLTWIDSCGGVGTIIDSCGEVGTAPSLYVGPSGDTASGSDRISNNGTVYFAEGGGTITLVFGNVGDAVLTITSIEIVKLNIDMTLSPVLADVTFPTEVQPTDYKQGDETVFTMTVYYSPDADRDISPTTFKVTTNDYYNQDGIFTFNVQPKGKHAEIKVTPNNAIFLGATSSSPDPVEFTIDNVGDAALALAGYRFTPETTAYSMTAGYIRENLMIDPYPYGTDNGAVNLTITYRPVNPPDQTDFEILWGSKIDTGVECSNTPTCQNSEKLCPDKVKMCPYTCFKGMCGCTMSADCANYFCDDPQDCEYRCLTSVCQIPNVTAVPLRGEAQ